MTIQKHTRGKIAVLVAGLLLLIGTGVVSATGSGEIPVSTRGGPSIINESGFFTRGNLNIEGRSSINILEVAGSATFNGSLNVTNDLAVSEGGTGKSSWTQYAIPYFPNETTFGAINIGAPGRYLKVNSAGNGYEWAEIIIPAATPATLPAGNNTEIQFNNNGVFGGSANLRWDGASGTLNVGKISSNGIHVNSGTARFDGDGAYVFELPASPIEKKGKGKDEQSPTGRIPVKVNGETKYIYYYDE